MADIVMNCADLGPFPPGIESGIQKWNHGRTTGVAIWRSDDPYVQVGIKTSGPGKLTSSQVEDLVSRLEIHRHAILVEGLTIDSDGGYTNG